MDVITHEVGLLQVEDDQVMPMAVGPQRARRCRSCFLVGRFPMNDAGNLLGSVLAHPLPDAHHVAARRIDNLARAPLYRLDGGDLRAEGWNDHDVAGIQFFDFLVGRMRRKIANSHGGELGIYLRVMDNLSQEGNPAIGENLPRRVGEVDRPLDSVAESELFGQSNNRSTLLEDPSLAANAFHEAAFVVAFDLRLHARHHIGRAEIDSRGFDGGGDLSAQGCSLKYWEGSSLKACGEISKLLGGSGSL